MNAIACEISEIKFAFKMGKDTNMQIVSKIKPKILLTQTREFRVTKQFINRIHRNFIKIQHRFTFPEHPSVFPIFSCFWSARGKKRRVNETQSKFFILQNTEMFSLLFSHQCFCWESMLKFGKKASKSSKNSMKNA